MLAANVHGPGLYPVVDIVGAHGQFSGCMVTASLSEHNVTCIGGHEHASTDPGFVFSLLHVHACADSSQLLLGSTIHAMHSFSKSLV